MNKLTILASLLLLPLSLNAQKMQISINTVDIMALGTLNLQFDCALTRHWSIGLSGKYNPFKYNVSEDGKGQFQLQQRCVSLNARWWPWHVYSGWWVSGRGQMKEYNQGGIFSSATEEGYMYGAGLSGGYTHMINAHLNVDFGLGMWAGARKYTVYACPRCGRKIESGIGTFVLPNDILVALTYVF